MRKCLDRMRGIIEDDLRYLPYYREVYILGGSREHTPDQRSKPLLAWEFV